MSLSLFSSSLDIKFALVLKCWSAIGQITVFHRHHSLILHGHSSWNYHMSPSDPVNSCWHHPLQLSVKILVRKRSFNGSRGAAVTHQRGGALLTCSQHLNNEAARCRLSTGTLFIIRLLTLYAVAFGWIYALFATMEMVKFVFAVLLLSNAFCQKMDVDDWREAIEKVRLCKFSNLWIYWNVIYNGNRENNPTPKFYAGFGVGKVSTFNGGKSSHA